MFRLITFGGLSLESALEPLPASAAQRRRLALLVLLASADERGVTREKLFGYLWPESPQKKARHALEQLLYATRRDLGKDVVGSSAGMLRLESTLMQADVIRFEAALACGKLEEAVALYAGPFLDGVYLNDAPAFERWAESERLRLQERFTGALEALAETAASRGEGTEAVEWWRRLAATDPLSSRYAAGLIRALAGSGDTAAALRQARIYEELVRREFELEPDPEVLALAERLRQTRAGNGDGAMPQALESASSQVVATPPAGPASEMLFSTPTPPDADAGDHPPDTLPNRSASLGAAAFASVLSTPRRAVRLALLGLAVVLVLGAGLLLLRSGGEVSASAGPAPGQTAIAVLPFQNLSGEEAHAYFAAGLHDELLTQLSKVADLTVISRTSVLGYEGTRTPLRQIARELGVGSVVEGSVQVVDGRLRVNVQLIDAATDAHLWANRYDRVLEDAFAIQSDIAQQIVAAVGARLTGAERQGLVQLPTANAEAYHFYLQGRDYHLNRPGGIRQNLQIAQQLLERAIELDPEFARAHAALSEVHGEIYWVRHDPTPARVARQREAAEAALRLAPQLPQAHFAMGLAHYWGHLDYHQALASFAIALEGLPNDARLWAFTGFVHRRMGNFTEARAAFEKAIQLNPRWANLFEDLGGGTYQLTRRYAEAVRAYDRALSLAPDHPSAAIQKGWTYVRWQGQLDTLRAVLSRVPADAEPETRGRRVTQHLQLLLLDRQADSLLHVLETTPPGAFEWQHFFLPSALYAAWAHQLRGDPPAARAAFDSARVVLDSVIVELPDDWKARAARGLVLAGLGHRDEALREADWLQQTRVYREDANFGPELAERRAKILAQAGALEEALDEIERLLARPSWLSVHTLRLHPLWDPIREHPRFQALLQRYAAR